MFGFLLIVYNIGFSTDHPADPAQLSPRELQMSEIIREIGDRKIQHLVVENHIPLYLIEHHSNLLSLRVTMKPVTAITHMRKIFRWILFSSYSYLGLFPLVLNPCQEADQICSQDTRLNPVLTRSVIDNDYTQSTNDFCDKQWFQLHDDNFSCMIAWW